MLLRTLLLAALAAPGSRRFTPAPVLGLRLPPLPLEGPMERSVLPEHGTWEAGRTAEWRGQIGAHAATVALHLVYVSRDECPEPEHLVSLYRTSAWAPDGPVCGHYRADPAHQRLVRHLRSRPWIATLEPGATRPGRTGWSDTAGVCQGALRRTADGAEGAIFLLGGLLEECGFVVEVTCSPPPPPAIALRIHAFLAGIRWQGPRTDPRWDEREVQQRLARELPPALLPGLLPPLRTEHYLILGTAPFGASFARQAEARYQRIRAAFPFPEVPGRRLLPIVLFRDRNEYQELCDQRRMLQPGAVLAWADAYATASFAPHDPVHLLGATRQLFRNRLFLPAGGGYLQEALAGFMAGTHVDRAAAVRALRRQPGADAQRFGFFADAGLWVAFLHDSDATAGHFQALIRAAACTPSASGAGALEVVLNKIAGRTSRDLDQDWRAWCDRGCRPPPDPTGLWLR